MPKASPPNRAELRNPNGVKSVPSGLKSNLVVKIAVSTETNRAAKNASWIAFCANLRLLTFGQNQAAPRPMSFLDGAELITHINQKRRWKDDSRMYRLVELRCKSTQA